MSKLATPVAAHTWVINIGGPGIEWHAVPADQDPGPNPSTSLIVDQPWPTTTTTSACDRASTYRRGGYLQSGLPRCSACCATTGTVKGYGRPS